MIEIGNNSQVALCQKTKQHKIKLRWLEPDEGDPRLQKKKKKANNNPSMGPILKRAESAGTKHQTN